MNKIHEVCETNKYFSRLKDICKGKGLLLGREIDKISFDNLEFQNLSDRVKLFDKKESFDYVVSNIFTDDFKNFTESNGIEDIISFVKPNGFVVFYIPHKFYFPFNGSVIPHDVLVQLRHIDKYMFEIVDFQTFGYDGSYSSQDLSKVEYSFYIILKKANSLFNKRDLSDDPGQLVSLDE